MEYKKLLALIVFASFLVFTALVCGMVWFACEIVIPFVSTVDGNTAILLITVAVVIVLIQTIAVTAPFCFQDRICRSNLHMTEGGSGT